jgi:excinuclease ABC subunit A
VLDELERRLAFLVRVGLGHLSLDRPAPTLSTGELQRVRLGASAGNQLSGVLYVLDEPTAGLHPRDTDALLSLLLELRDAGNTLLVVEHDLAVVRAADVVVDFGPGPGREGGRVVFRGPPSALEAADTPTGRWLSGRDHLPGPVPVRPGGALRIRGARGHNLQGVDVDLPLGALVAVTGVSGAGKSSLVEDTLGRAVARRLGGGGPPPLPHDRIDGIESIMRLVRADAGGPARSPRSNAATWTKVWDDVRTLFAKLPESKLRGWGPERFSLHLPGGRCEACSGEGVTRVDLHLLPEITLPCEVCEGRRFEDSTLAATFRGASIADVLAMPVREARALFANLPAIAGPLGQLDELGLGYLPLGQPGDTLSGGEAQRLGLARELARPGVIPGTLYLLDEPSVGLHPADVEVLLAALRRLVDSGGSVVLVEHDPGLLGACDHLVEIGPGAGRDGGRVVSSGPP